MDLLRPESPAHAHAIVEATAAAADPILKQDFFHSLLATLVPEEVCVDLAAAGLGHLGSEVVSDRHWLVSGRR
jgi:hypothetical protein